MVRIRKTESYIGKIEPDGIRNIVVMPGTHEWLERYASDVLARYTRLLTGERPGVVPDDRAGRLAEGRAYFILGKPDRNLLAKELLEKGKFPALKKLPKHPDAFVVLSDVLESGARVVLLAGNTPVSTLYAIYDYLEKDCGVGFFQDGEHVPKRRNIPAEGLDRTERPRFDNRLHLAWNAHRAIKKYHSFWWTLDDWKREFDWMLKRRMNMLRLDMGYYSRFAGDTFQQAFPEIGDEPDEVLYPRLAGWTCSWGWPPMYRRRLMQQILEYGRKLGIRFIYTMSLGTVPFRFKDKHPEFEYLLGNQYGESREISPYDPGSYEVEKKHLAKMIEIFGTDHLYMYTPYAEIDVGKGSQEKNLEMRIEAAKRIRKLIKEVDREGIWVTDTWDLACSKRWNKRLVKKYLDSFPNKGMYLYETASESLPMYKKYNHWHGKEWAFGVIHSFAGKEILHGNAHQTIQRANEASKSKTCTGLFMVPESTHHNIMFWDMTTQLAWQPSEVSFDKFLKDYVERRYGPAASDDMYEAWKKITKVCYKPVRARGLSQYVYGEHPWYHWLYDCPIFRKREKQFDRAMKNVDEEIALLGDAMKILLKHSRKQRDNPVYAEDVVVVFLNYTAKRFQREAGKAYIDFKKSNKRGFRKYRDRAMEVVKTVPEVLSVCPSYSINRTIDEACSVNKHNRFLPEMIRQACLNVGYVNNDVYEQFPGHYIPITIAVFDHMAKKLAEGEKVIYRKDVKDEFGRIEAEYRTNGWRPKKKATGSPTRMTAKMFLKLEAMKK